ncbi:hypothetical protein BCR44DRAFT_156058 [Catenaria anguillulae PL171]|uniref:RWD domain-containing protein n=1 Tax=Catenaria anguillulae PL171 TaxID=765915 RepID=A0A1Y2HGP1_9FUNG|nr:hypothetical protein BCR44DRAFT_156058 [Catenaria anguillulae PL171]
MDYDQEQQNEVEILKSIFFDEFIDLSDPPSVRHYALALTPDESVFSDLFAAEEDYIRKKWRLYLTVTVPETYPEAAPELHLSLDPPESAIPTDAANDSDADAYGDSSDEEDLSYDPEEDEDHPLHPLRSLDHLISFADEQAASLAGEILVFTVVSALKEEMAAQATQLIHAHRAAEAERIRLEEEADNAKFRGTPVTIERFIEWKRKFDAEMAEKKLKAKAAEEKAAGVSAAVRARSAAAAAGAKTGRQLFESDKSLVMSDSRFLGEDDESVDAHAMAADQAAEGLERINLDEDDEENNVAAMLMHEKLD